MGLLDVNTASEKLGVSRQRVAQWISAGDLPAQKIAGRWVIDSNDLAALHHRAGAGRPVSSASAWRMLLMSHDPDGATGSPAEILSPVQRAHARMRLHELSEAVKARDPDALNSRLRRLLGKRAVRSTYKAAPADCEDLGDDPRIALAGVSSPAVNISPGSTLEAYVAANDAETIIEDYLLESSPPGTANVILHVTATDAPHDWKHWAASPVLLAADLAEHTGTRESLEAFRILARALAKTNPDNPELKKALDL